MRIGIDARLFGTDHGGIGRYTEQLIKKMEKTGSTDEYFVFLQQSNFEKYQPAAANWHKVLADYRAYSLGEQLFFPWLLRKYRLDLVHFTHFNLPIFYGKKFIVTIHDLIISHYPTSRATTLPAPLYAVKLFFYRLIVALAARRASKIIAITEYTKQDIIKMLRIPAAKICVVYEGVDLPEVTEQQCERLLQHFDLPEQFALYVGSAYPHKNLEKLIDAWQLVIAEHPDCYLVLTGKISFFYERLKRYVAEKAWKDKIVFTGYLSDAELSCIYCRAKIYVFPSLLEGFGLPPLEAQHFGLPVVCSCSSCLPEALGESAIYFDPHDIEDMAEKISLGLNDSALRNRLVEMGRQNIQRFSWDKMAQEIHELYTSFDRKSKLKIEN